MKKKIPPANPIYLSKPLPLMTHDPAAKWAFISHTLNSPQGSAKSHKAFPAHIRKIPRAPPLTYPPATPKMATIMLFFIARPPIIQVWWWKLSHVLIDVGLKINVTPFLLPLIQLPSPPPPLRHQRQQKRAKQIGFWEGDGGRTYAPNPAGPVSWSLREDVIKRAAASASMALTWRWQWCDDEEGHGEG